MTKYFRYNRILLVITLLLLVSGCGGILDPKGFIAMQQKNLILFAAGIMLVVIIPVIVLTIYFSFKYRESNHKAGDNKYDPSWTHSSKLEVVWWGIPCIIILILAITAWNTSHSLDPAKPLDNSNKPLVIEVVSLDWKWLFIYPEQGIATINYIKAPENTPLHFKLTSDAPMNAFWVPQLGSLIYVMAGMQTQLHLIAYEKGKYAGVSGNYSGYGFSGMKFVVDVTDKDTFSEWVSSVKSSSNVLSKEKYTQLMHPTLNNQIEYFSTVEKNLFMGIMGKYMMVNGKAMTSHTNMGDHVGMQALTPTPMEMRSTLGEKVYFSVEH